MRSPIAKFADLAHADAARSRSEIERLRVELAWEQEVGGALRAEIERLREALRDTWNAVDTNQLDRAMGIIRAALAGKEE